MGAVMVLPGCCSSLCFPIGAVHGAVQAAVVVGNTCRKVLSGAYDGVIWNHRIIIGHPPIRSKGYHMAASA